MDAFFELLKALVETVIAWLPEILSGLFGWLFGDKAVGLVAPKFAARMKARVK